VGRGHALGLLVVALVAGCAKPPPDLDGEPGGAIGLPLGQVHADTLACKKGDCADWYKIAIPGAGKLSVEVDSAAVGKNAAGGLAAKLVDPNGAALGQADGAAPRLHSDVSEGVLLVQVTPASPDAELSYEITARFKPAPAPPPKPVEPRFETRSAAVLEVEGERTEHIAVLLDAGEGAKLVPGLRGRLVDQGKTIGSIVIQDVYPDGSRARVEGRLAGQITPHTSAEIEIPIATGAPAPGAESPPEK
jgi:hypothetical protein